MKTMQGIEIDTSTMTQLTISKQPYFVSDTAIYRQYGNKLAEIKLPSRIEQIRRMLKLKKNNRTAVMEERMRMYEQGLNDNEIADIQGICAFSVCQWRRRRDLPAQGKAGRKAG